jgi:four helix bundle protein
MTMTNREFSEAMKVRTKAFAVRVIKLVDSLPGKVTCREIGRQLLRAGMSVGANYRAACRARSNAEFCSKLGIVEEEADESVFWMELLIESGHMKPDKLSKLIAEGQEILRIVISSIKTSRKSDSKKAVRNALPAA